MKRIRYILLALFAIFTFRIYGDIIIKVGDPLKISVRIENPDSYPGIVIVGVNDCFAASRPEVNVFDSSSCMEVHKACRLTFYAVKKDYLEKKKIYKINWEKDKNVMKSNTTVDLNSLRSDVESVDIYFYVAGFNENSMVMYKTKQITKYFYIKPDKIDNFFGPKSALGISPDSLSKRLNLRKSF